MNYDVKRNRNYCEWTDDYRKCFRMLKAEGQWQQVVWLNSSLYRIRNREQTRMSVPPGFVGWKIKRRQD